MVTFFLQAAVMLAMALLSGQLARRLRFPAVLGELVGGIVLGPTVWGLLSPGTRGRLFPASEPYMDGLIQLSMLFFLFAAGLEINLGQIRSKGRTIVWTSLLGMLFPFILGVAAVFLFPGLWGTHTDGKTLLFALFMGTAMSISALPVIARILMDLGLMKSSVGAVILGAATVDDLAGWSLFALILGSFAPDGLPWYLSVFLVIALFVFMLTVGRHACRRAQDWLRQNLPWPGVFLGLAIALMLFASALAGAMGIHAVFGAFLAGAALSRGQEKRDEAHEIIYQLTMYFFAPLYFVSVGMRVNFIQSFDPLLVAVVLLVACAGKLAGGALGAKVGGLSGRQALSVGFAMNARGAMEIILATAARDVGLIDDRVFVALVTVALVTSLLSGPVISRLCAPRPERPPAAPEAYRRMADFEDPFPVEED